MIIEVAVKLNVAVTKYIYLDYDRWEEMGRKLTSDFLFFPQRDNKKSVKCLPIDH